MVKIIKKFLVYHDEQNHINNLSFKYFTNKNSRSTFEIIFTKSKNLIKVNIKKSYL